MWKQACLLIGLGMSGPALADDEPRFCPSRPSLGSSACTTEPGQVHLEVSAVDWQSDHTLSKRDHERAGWGLPNTYRCGSDDRSPDRLDPLRSTIGLRTSSAAQSTDRPGVGDLTLGVRQNLRNPGGQGLSFGIEGKRYPTDGSMAR